MFPGRSFYCPAGGAFFQLTFTEIRKFILAGGVVFEAGLIPNGDVL
jgi:hypothetical protein